MLPVTMCMQNANQVNNFEGASVESGCVSCIELGGSCSKILELLSVAMKLCFEGTH